MQHPWDNSTIFYQQDKKNAATCIFEPPLCADNPRETRGLWLRFFRKKARKPQIKYWQKCRTMY